MNAPFFAAHKKTSFIEIFGNLFHAYTRRIFSVDVEREDFADNLGLGWINIQFLFKPSVCACAPRVNRPKTKGSLCAVKVTLPRIFIHAAQGMLGVFFALIFIKHHDQMAEQLARWIIVCLLRDGIELDPDAVELAFIKYRLRQITEETRITVNNDCLKRRGFLHCRRNHFLKLWPLIIRGGCASLNIFSRNNVAVALAPVAHLAQLVRD
ncbi:MAG: hypothetical protein RBT70_08400 [Alphaproteobacteria bacterium]|nr:hypothetical protein [Alphaproteobacteria bacterium]